MRTRFGVHVNGALAVVAAAALFASGGCDDDDDGGERDAGIDMRVAGDAAAPDLTADAGGPDQLVSDAGPDGGAADAAAISVPPAEVFGVLMAANTAAVQEGQLALAKSMNSDVRAYAQREVDEHTAANAALESLARQLGVTPAASAASAEILEANGRALADLATKSGVAFDQAYIAEQVGLHSRVLSAIDSRLLATDDEQVAALVKDTVRPAIASHLQDAAAIWAGLDP